MYQTLYQKINHSKAEAFNVPAREKVAARDEVPIQRRYTRW